MGKDSSGEVNNADLLRKIDHTNLHPDASVEDIVKLCEEAKQYGFGAVCVNPIYIRVAKESLLDTDCKVATVIGFPLGSTFASVKVFESKEAVQAGADELDMVMSIGLFKSGKYQEVQKEIEDVVKESGDKIVKVIIETALLSESEKRDACKIVMDSGADFVKTSTGFSKGGATIDDIRLMREEVGDKLQIKASGGIRDLKFMLDLIKAGANRIGASSSVAIAKELLGY